MLQAMRRNSRHAIIYVLFGILIAAFVISFGPGSRGFGYQGVSSAYAAKVAGSTVSEQDFHFAYVALGRTRYPPQMAREQRLKEQLMDRINTYIGRPAVKQLRFVPLLPGVQP